MGGWEVDRTGESRDNGFAFRMADDERRVLVAQSLGSDQHPHAVKQFGCQSKPERFNASNLGPVARGVNRLARALIPPLRRMNVASGSELDLYSIAYRSTRDHFDRVRLPTLLGSEVQRKIAANRLS